MLHHHETELSFAAYVIAAAIIVGSIIISATGFYAFKKMTDQGVVAVAGNPSGAQGQQAQGGKTAIKLPANTQYLGNPNAKVTVIEYADYRCPFCEQFYKTVMPDLQAKYISTGKIKFVYQDVAFLGPDSTTAGEAVYCATEQNKFWQFHDYLFAHQGNESTDWASAVNEKNFAATLGLNTTQFNSCLDSGKYAKQMTTDTTVAQTYGVQGTPTTFVNGILIEGAQPAAAFDAAIESALK